MESRPSTMQRESTAQTARAVRPANHQRQSTARTTRTARTARTERDVDYNMAGPPHQSHTNDPHRTYYEEGYQRLNPQMNNEKPAPNFSLASTFPHKVRWGRKQPKDGDPKAVEDVEKVGTEPAPMVDEANEQGTRQDGGKEEEGAGRWWDGGCHDSSLTNCSSQIWRRSIRKMTRPIHMFNAAQSTPTTPMAKMWVM